MAQTSGNPSAAQPITVGVATTTKERTNQWLNHHLALRRKTRHRERPAVTAGEALQKGVHFKERVAEQGEREQIGPEALAQEQPPPALRSSTPAVLHNGILLDRTNGSGKLHSKEFYCRVHADWWENHLTKPAKTNNATT